MRATTMLVMLTALAGCPRPYTGIVGKNGRLDFGWPRGHIAAGGGRLPMIVWTSDRSERPTFTRVESSNPAVGTATPYQSNRENLLFISGEPGTTELALYDANDQLLDAVDVEVTAAARIQAQPPTLDGDVVHVRATAYAADGIELTGFWAIRAEAHGAIEVPEEERDYLPDLDIAVRVFAPPATLSLVAYGARAEVALSAF